MSGGAGGHTEFKNINETSKKQKSSLHGSEAGNSLEFRTPAGILNLPGDESPTAVEDRHLRQRGGPGANSPMRTQLPRKICHVTLCSKPTAYCCLSSLSGS